AMAWASPEVLYADHVDRWNELWQGDIEIEGDDEAQQVVRMALFNLYGFCREGSRLSISPMGLSLQGYAGHVFWDSEIWMYPPMLFMNHDIARSMMDYRSDRLASARRRASASGYRGAMYPWESDDFGEESTPTFAVTGLMEHHITADVAIAAWNYYRMTGDRDWLRDEGWPILKDVAEFWVSRVTPNADGSYSIKHVVGADEYAIAVDDNAFTNGAAKVALRNAVSAAQELGYVAPAKWGKVADGIRIHKNSDGVTLEHADYDGYIVKQADVNLLAYPLGLITDPKEIEADLDYYLSKLDLPNGPAMSFGIFCVEYARLGNVAKAEDMFRRSYRPNLRKPFGALAETASSNNPYFATGAGGLLQAVINGFGGLELTDNGIVQLPSVLPKNWRRLTIKGVGPERRTYTVER
ncbi:MAG: glycoside hydrolase family 65 protein, partial [Muribaculaceae bacterium]|nr:glycoside hydrolase family 65 protein [Muribaculaceae bacterium]